MDAAQNTPTQSTLRRIVTKEAALLSGFLLFGLVALPIIIYKVGIVVFDVYGGAGFGDFYRTLSGKIRQGDAVAWFLVLSPYIGWQCLRLLAAAWRMTGRGPHMARQKQA